MSLDNKDELARRTGMTQPSRVEDAVRRRVAAMQRIAADFRAVTTEEQRAAMAAHSDWLYDEHGLPH